MSDDTRAVLVERLREMERTCLEMAGTEAFAGLRTAWLERCEALREAVYQLAAPVGEQEKACVTCRHFLPWNRQAMRGNGDCHQPRLRGHLNGIEETFGCRLHERHP